jgi:transposase
MFDGVAATGVFTMLLYWMMFCALAPNLRTTEKCGIIEPTQKEAAGMGRKSEFSREEKITAVKLVTEGGRSPLSVANEYGIHENTLWKWKRQYAINPEGAFNGEPVLDEASAQERELQQLKRRVRELEEENDFLKKVSAYFARNPR